MRIAGGGVGDTGGGTGTGPALGMGVGKGNTDGGLAIAASPPEAGEAGDDEVGDSTICNLFCPLSLSSEHSELGDAEEVAEVARRPRCQSLGLRMSNSAVFLS